MVKSQSQKKKNTKAGSRPAPKPKARNMKVERAPRHHLHDRHDRDCAKHYAQTVMNPFDTPAGACVPSLPCLDSAKRKVFARGVGACESAGFGGINCATCMSSDGNSVVYTTGVSTGGGGATSLQTANTASKGNNSELTDSDFTNKLVQGRVVGCGIRIRYTGKQVDMNGTVYALEEPAHLKTTAMTIEDLRGYDRVKTMPFSREWVVATWQPVLPEETTFSTSSYGTLAPSTPLIILIDCQGAPAGTTYPFEWEFYLHYEAIGSAARGKTRSHVSPLLGPRVTAALQQAPTTLFDDISNRKVNTSAVAERMMDHGSSWLRTADDIFKGVARSAAAAITSRAAAQYMGGGLMAIGL